MEELFETNQTIMTSMLLDEEKLLTYVSISKELCVHINSSKILLRRLVAHIRKCSPDQEINVSYILSGSLKNKNARTIVCSEKDLNEQRKCFEKIFFEHIYSVSKGRSCTDNASLLTINKFDDFVLCSGLIKSSQCDKRTSVEIGNLKSNSQEIVLPEKSKSLPVPVKKVKQESITFKHDSHVVNPISTNTETKSEPVIKQEILTPKKEPLVNNKQKVNTANGNKTQRGIIGFFNKPNKKDLQHEQEINSKLENNIKVETAKVEDESHKIVTTNKNKQNDLQGNDTEVTSEGKSKISNNDNNQPNNKMNVPINSQKESNGKIILNQIKKNSKVDKKRKRVLCVSDSDSEHENNDPFKDEPVSMKVENLDQHESDDEIPPTPSAININIRPGLVNPKKKRKVIDKTYTDEDGYILTKKVEVYESCSENEEDLKTEEKATQEKLPKVEISPKVKPGPKKKISPPKKNNQPTLTNFFKRK